MPTKNSTYIIAEAGVNHNGQPDLAFQLAELAAKAGANAVKFQTFSAKNLVTSQAKKADYQLKTTQSEESQLEMLSRLELSQDTHQLLIEHCQRLNIDFLSTPFDIESLDFLTQQLGQKTIKISSGDITHGPLLLRAAQQHANIILSTGMSDLQDVREALNIIAFGYQRQSVPTMADITASMLSDKSTRLLQQKVSLLHCVTEYPAPFHSVNLSAMQTLANEFNLPVGLSDHTEGINIPIAATALGARIIEKHVTLDRQLPGPDHLASLDPEQLTAMVRGIREVEQAIGTGNKVMNPIEKENRDVIRKSLIASTPIGKGDLFTHENLSFKRPGTGISPKKFWNKIGHTAEESYETDDLIK